MNEELKVKNRRQIQLLNRNDKPESVCVSTVVATVPTVFSYFCYCFYFSGVSMVVSTTCTVSTLVLRFCLFSTVSPDVSSVVFFYIRLYCYF